MIFNDKQTQYTPIINEQKEEIEGWVNNGGS